MLRSGFFSSKNHDRLYYNSDISRLFNSLIIDGVFQNVGNKFIARPGTGMEVIIPSGLAYFNSTWIFNDTDYVVSINAAPIVAGPKKRKKEKPIETYQKTTKFLTLHKLYCAR